MSAFNFFAEEDYFVSSSPITYRMAKKRSSPSGESDDEHIVVDDLAMPEHVLESDRNEHRNENIIETIEKKYILLPKSDKILLTAAATKDDGVDDSILEGAPSTLGATYTVAPPAYTATTDFSMDYSHLPSAYVYSGNNAYYYEYQPQPIASPTSNSYIIHQQHHAPASPASNDDEPGGNSLGHAARASPATIQWLKANYEKAEGSSLPRCTLYEHYKKHCQQTNIDPVNAASFGKLIRSIFEGLRTRRLGTRGNSKYHYYGIRLRPTSLLAHQSSPEYESEATTTSSTVRTSSSSQRRGNTMRNEKMHSPVPAAFSTPAHGSEQPSGNASSFQTYQQPNPSPLSFELSEGTDADRKNLGQGEVPRFSLTANIDLQNCLAEVRMSTEHVAKFVEAYHVNCQEILFCIKNLNFDSVEECWTTFWQPESEGDEPDDGSGDRLSQHQLFSLCTISHIQKYITIVDYAFYQVLCEVLVPDLLANKHTLSEQLNTRMRNFAKTVEGSLRKAMHGAPDVIVKKKCLAVRMFAQALRRYTSLSHLSHAARMVFVSEEQTKLMVDDLNRVDMNNIQEQADWVCKCDSLMLRQLTESFKDNLLKKKTLDEWAEWMEAVVDQVLAKYHDRSVAEIAIVSKKFLLNWSFYSSLVIRDLTLRSALSFGHFHLIRLLFDEYMLYLIESRLAKTVNKPMLNVMAASNENELIEDISFVQRMTGNHAIDDNRMFEEVSYMNGGYHDESIERGPPVSRMETIPHNELIEMEMKTEGL